MIGESDPHFSVWAHLTFFAWGHLVECDYTVRATGMTGQSSVRPMRTVPKQMWSHSYRECNMT